MTDNRGVFTLRKIIEDRVPLDRWVDLQEVWISPSPFISYSPDTAPDTGYFGGGDEPGPRSTMDKVTYASDTTAAVPSAALSVARSFLAATGNSTHGYFGGGSPGPKSTMDKLSYADDTTAAVPGANLTGAPGARSFLAATGIKQQLFWWW